MSGGGSGQIVIELRIVKHFADAGTGVIKFRGGVGKIGAGLFVCREERVVRVEFAERAFSGLNIIEHRVPFSNHLTELIVQLGVVN